MKIRTIKRRHGNTPETASSRNINLALHLSSSLSSLSRFLYFDVISRFPSCQWKLEGSFLHEWPHLSVFIHLQYFSMPSIRATHDARFTLFAKQPTHACSAAQITAGADDLETLEPCIYSQTRQFTGYCGKKKIKPGRHVSCVGSGERLNDPSVTSLPDNHKTCPCTRDAWETVQNSVLLNRWNHWRYYSDANNLLFFGDIYFFFFGTRYRICSPMQDGESRCSPYASRTALCRSIRLSATHALSTNKI